MSQLEQIGEAGNVSRPTSSSRQSRARWTRGSASASGALGERVSDQPFTSAKIRLREPVYKMGKKIQDESDVALVVGILRFDN
jgi:hypothetical protein